MTFVTSFGSILVPWPPCGSILVPKVNLFDDFWASFGALGLSFWVHLGALASLWVHHGARGGKGHLSERKSHHFALFYCRFLMFLRSQRDLKEWREGGVPAPNIRHSLINSTRTYYKDDT